MGHVRKQEFSSLLFPGLGYGVQAGVQCRLHQDGDRRDAK